MDNAWLNVSQKNVFVLKYMHPFVEKMDKHMEIDVRPIVHINP